MNMEILHGLKYPEFMEMTNTQRCVAVADALMVCALCQRKYLSDQKGLSTKIKRGQEGDAEKGL